MWPTWPIVKKKDNRKWTQDDPDVIINKDFKSCKSAQCSEKKNAYNDCKDKDVSREIETIFFEKPIGNFRTQKYNMWN